MDPGGNQAVVSVRKCLCPLPSEAGTGHSSACLVPEASASSEGLGLFGASAVSGSVGDSEP